MKNEMPELFKFVGFVKSAKLNHKRSKKQKIFVFEKYVLLFMSGRILTVT